MLGGKRGGRQLRIGLRQSRLLGGRARRCWLLLQKRLLKKQLLERRLHRRLSR